MINQVTDERPAGKALKASKVKAAPVSYEIFETTAAAARQIRNQIDDGLTDLKADLEGVKAKHLKSLRTLSRALAARVVELTTLVDENRELFDKPRTTVLHEIKLGLSGGKGKLAYDDEQDVIRLIRKRLGTKKQTLIRTTHALVADAVKNLPADELVKIGCRIDGKDDSVVVTFVDGEIEKAMGKLLNGIVDAMLETNDEAKA